MQESTQKTKNKPEGRSGNFAKTIMGNKEKSKVKVNNPHHHESEMKFNAFDSTQERTRKELKSSMEKSIKSRP